MSCIFHPCPPAGLWNELRWFSCVFAPICAYLFFAIDEIGVQLVSADLLRIGVTCTYFVPRAERLFFALLRQKSRRDDALA